MGCFESQTFPGTVIEAIHGKRDVLLLDAIADNGGQTTVLCSSVPCRVSMGAASTDAPLIFDFHQIASGGFFSEELIESHWI